MCLSHLGEHEAARALESATIQVLEELPAMRGPQMGCTTSEVGERIRRAMATLARAGLTTTDEAPRGTFRSRTDLSAERG